MLNSQKWMLLIALIGLTSLSLGCRNNCNNPCGNQPFYGGQPGFGGQPIFGGQRQGLLGANGLIPPQATGSLNIPSVARNTYPYNNTGGYGSGLNTRGPAPTPANRTSNSNSTNRSNGWRPSNGNDFGANSNQNSGANSVSVLASNGSAAGSNNSGSGLRTASNTSTFGNPNGTTSGSSAGSSYVESPNYATTTINETNDRTRLPVNNAVDMRAPSQYYQASNGNRFAQANNGVYVNPNRPMPTGVNGSFSNSQQYYAPGNGQTQSGNGYVGAFANQGAYAPNGYRPVPQNGNLQGNFQVASTAPTILGQSTTVYDPYRGGGSTRQADWRDRELGSDSFR